MPCSPVECFAELCRYCSKVLLYRTMRFLRAWLIIIAKEVLSSLKRVFFQPATSPSGDMRRTFFFLFLEKTLRRINIYTKDFFYLVEIPFKPQRPLRETCGELSFFILFSRHFTEDGIPAGSMREPQSPLRETMRRPQDSVKNKHPASIKYYRLSQTSLRLSKNKSRALSD